MNKKDILTKLKDIPDDITDINEIVNYIFGNEKPIEKITYLTYRSTRLKEMINDSMIYKEKLAIISIEWKKLK